MGNATIDIIIVNWNAGRQLSDCLNSIMVAHRQGFELGRVVVVDNASVDGSAEELDRLGLPITVIRNMSNRGFAPACNQGAYGSEADYLLFLNPDTRLFEKSLTKALAFMEQPDKKHIGIVGVQLVDECGRISRTCARFPTAGLLFSKTLGLDHLFPERFPSSRMTEWDHTASREVDQVMGAFFLVRRVLFDFLGGFDERFFVYYEEVDFSLRAWQAGWRSYYLAETQAYHKGGGTSERVKAARLFYSLRSRILYGYKHLGWWTATSLMLGTLMLEPLARLVLLAFRRDSRQLLETFKGYSMLWGATADLVRAAWDAGKSNRNSRPVSPHSGRCSVIQQVRNAEFLINLLCLYSSRFPRRRD